MKFLKTTIYLLLLIIASPGYPGKVMAQDKPNILWIVSEDNSSFLGAYGDSLARTPNLDRFAEQSVLYENAFATSPVCAPSRFTLITGMYSNAMGTENMRSTYPIPDFIKFYPKYLKDAGYYTTNNSKKDYNTVDQPEVWDESSHTASYKNRADGQPFFHVKNIFVSHESQIHGEVKNYDTNPDSVTVPPYLPSTEAVRKDIAHYYDQIAKMDNQVDEILDELKKSGQADNTIVFYYSDHGGVLPRSKRFMFESGLHIPMMIHFPEKYAFLSPDKEQSDHVVSFVDFAPTLLSLAGIKPPDYMQGKAFLGPYKVPDPDYIYMNRGRMDERYDLVRTVRDKKFLYVHNYMPQRIYGQHIMYLWKAASMQSWDKKFQKGQLNDVQKQFWQAKPAEELYEFSSDPYSIHNLADDPDYQSVLKRMRKANVKHLKEIQDLGFIPESMIDDIRGDKSLYSAAREQNIPVDKIIDTAERASYAKKGNLDTLANRLNNNNKIVRYWAAMGFVIAGKDAKKYEPLLMKHAKDPSYEVRLQIAEALYHFGNEQKAFSLIQSALDRPNDKLKLNALNILESLDPKNVPSALKARIQTIDKKYGSMGKPEPYIHRVTQSLLDKID